LPACPSDKDIINIKVRSIGGMILTGVNCNTWMETCASTTYSFLYR